MAAPWEEKYEKAPDAAPAKTVVAPSLLPATATPEGVFKGEPGSMPANMPPPALERVETNAKQAVSDVGGASQDFLSNHPGLWALPAAYGAHKVADKIGLYGTLADKLKNKSTAEPAPSRNPLPINPDPNNVWDIHNEPPLFANENPEPKVSEPAASGQNLTLKEAQDRMAGVKPPVASVETPVAPTALSEPLVADTTPPAEQPKASKVTPVAPPMGELKTGSGLTAYPGQGKPRERFPKEFKNVAEIPAGYAFVPGMGPGTNVIRNDFGQAGYNELVKQQGKPFGEDKETREFIKKFNEERVGPPMTREMRKTLGVPFSEPTKGIPIKKAVVGGLGAGAILAIPDLANAAENKDALGTAEVVGGILPPQLQALLYSKGAGEGEDKELARIRRLQEYAKKSGRGVAQGYDPRRLIGVAPPN